MTENFRIIETQTLEPGDVLQKEKALPLTTHDKIN